MIILFHMAYVIATSLVNVITHTFFNAGKTQQNNNELIEAIEHIGQAHPENDCSVTDLGVDARVQVGLEVSAAKGPHPMNMESSGLGLGLDRSPLHNDKQTTDYCSLSPSCKIQGDSHDSLPAKATRLDLTLQYESEDSDADFKPIPPVYAQRYLAVKSVLMDEKWNGQIKKVIDYGCNNLAFFQYVKHMIGVEEVLLVDIDEDLLKQSSCRVAPLNCDYLVNRPSPLHVKVLGGSIAEQDSRLIGTDAVICIELIEHLWPEEVEAVPYTVFGFIHPKVAVFTTPNADFNVVFKSFTGFRHPDHKFEWTREQFECWANNIVERYPAYEVTFHGIGVGPLGTEAYGCCSQMAVFSRLADLQPVEIEPGEIYKLICDYDYPFRVDNRTIEEKICHEAEYYIHRYSKDEIHYLEDGCVEIPLIILLPHVETMCDSIEGLRKTLEGAGWIISDRNPDIPAVIYPYYSSYSSSDEEEDRELETSLQSEEELVERDYLQSTEDWDECSVSPNFPGDKAEAGNSLSQLPLNGWDVISCRSETILPLSLLPKQEVMSHKENCSPLLADSCLIQNASCSSHGVEGAIVMKPSTSLSNNTVQLNGECHEELSSTGNAKVEAMLNGFSSEVVPVGMLFQSNTIGSISESDSGIVVSGRCVKSLDDVALSRAAQTSDFLSNSLQATRSVNGVDRTEVPREYSELSSADSIVNIGISASMENNASSSREFTQQVIDASDSSRSFFLNLLSNERETRHDVSRSTSNEVDVGTSVSDQRMDLDLSPDLEDYDSVDSDDSLSGHSQDGGYHLVDNRAVPRRVQPHRNHFPFGLNDVVVENGDVANNNRDGEGNNAVPLEDIDVDDDDDDDIFEIDIVVGDHEEEDEDFDNANDLILPDHADPFPPWLLHLLQVANDERIELGAAGEPHIFLGDL